jgi:hypothetical protein
LIEDIPNPFMFTVVKQNFHMYAKYFSLKQINYIDQNS